MRYLVLVAGLTAGCSALGGKSAPQLTPADFAQAGACYAQVATLVQTAQQQVSACVDLAKSLRTKVQ